MAMTSDCRKPVKLVLEGGRYFLGKCFGECSDRVEQLRSKAYHRARGDTPELSPESTPTRQEFWCTVHLLELHDMVELEVENSWSGLV